MENQDLEDGSISVYDMPEYPENSSYLPTEGSAGTIPTPYVIIGKDDREVVTNTTRIPYRYIRKLEIRIKNSNTMYVGTGFLVGKSTILTAGHCAYISGKTITSIKFYPGKNGSSNPYGSNTVTNIHVPTKYKNAADTGNSTDEAKYDYALLELNSEAGSKLGYFGLGGYNTKYNIDNLTNTKATLVGYPGTPGNILYRHKATITGFNAGGYLMYYNMDSTGGQSGAPIIKYTDGKYYIIGIHNGGFTDGSANIGRYITNNIYQLVNKYK